MTNVLNPNTVTAWATVIMLLLAIADARARAKERRRDILRQLREFRQKLKYTVQEDSLKNVEAIRDEMSDYLCATKGIIAFDSFFCSIGYHTDHFSNACRLYMQHTEGVTLDDRIYTACDLIEDLIWLMEQKV